MTSITKDKTTMFALLTYLIFHNLLWVHTFQPNWLSWVKYYLKNFILSWCLGFKDLSNYISFLISQVVWDYRPLRHIFIWGQLSHVFTDDWPDRYKRHCGMRCICAVKLSCIVVGAQGAVGALSSNYVCHTTSHCLLWPAGVGYRPYLHFRARP